MFIDGSDIKISNVNPGFYSVDFYPASSFNCDVNIQNRTITLDTYIAPSIDIPTSGGISCTAASTTLTINLVAGTGTRVPMQYRVKEENDANFTNWQASNLFTVAPGKYTVEVQDGCGAGVTQEVYVFRGDDQFVEIIGESSPGIVCMGKPVQLAVLSVGPVSNYKWHKLDADGVTWNILPSIGSTYDIPSASLSDKGEYRVTITNTEGCDLSSQIKIVDVIELATTPTIIGPTNLCYNSLIILQVNTTEASPTYQWYNNGVQMDNRISDTILITQAGKYTVTVSTPGKCPSEPSAMHNVVVVYQPAKSSISGSVWLCSVSNMLYASEYASEYTWFKNGVEIPLEKSQMYYATTTGAYTVSANEGYCISDESDPFTIKNCPFEAIKDTVVTMGEITFDPLANDILNTPCQTPNLSVAIVGALNNGSIVTNADNTLTYTPNPSFAGKDSVQYSVTCTSVGTKTAWIYFIRQETPIIRLLDSCSFKPYMSLNIEYSNTIYQWQHYNTGTSVWEDIVGNTGIICNSLDAGLYRVKINYRNSTEVYTEQKELFILKKVNSGGRIWYQTELR